MSSLASIENVKYQHQAFPSTRYHEDGRVQIVKSKEEADELCPASEGWAGTPFAAKPVKPAAAEPNAEELASEFKRLLKDHERLSKAHVSLLESHEHQATEIDRLKAQLAKKKLPAAPAAAEEPAKEA